jgi:WD40 repeat protein
VSLYDVETGVELASLSHPQASTEKDPWAAEIRKVMFSPDGSKLITSSYDTRVWLIQRLIQR